MTSIQWLHQHASAWSRAGEAARDASGPVTLCVAKVAGLPLGAIGSVLGSVAGIAASTIDGTSGYTTPDSKDRTYVPIARSASFVVRAGIAGALAALGWAAYAAHAGAGIVGPFDLATLSAEVGVGIVAAGVVVTGVRAGAVDGYRAGVSLARQTTHAIADFFSSPRSSVSREA